MTKELTVYMYSRIEGTPDNIQQYAEAYARREGAIDYKWVLQGGFPFFVPTYYDEDQVLQNALWCLADHLDNIDVWEETELVTAIDAHTCAVFVDRLRYGAQGYNLTLLILS